MALVREASPTVAAGNSQAEISGRVASGQLTWLGPLLVVTGRSVFLIAAQAVVAGIFVLFRHPSPWSAAAPWWSVYATLADLGCLALIVHFAGKEGLRLRDLVGRIRWRRGFDLFLALIILAAAAFCFWVVAKPVSLIAFGTVQPYLYPGLASGRALPLWAVVYSFSIWLLIWTPTEEITYQGYCLPRIYALSKRWWVAVLIVSFWFALQHSFLPLIFDWHYILWRFLAFWPAMIALNLLYLRIRRLPPFILAHWAMDILALVLTLKF
jgi:membrane protease YdiL (CAAX protease family)